MTRSRKPERIRPLDAALRRIADADRRLRQAAAVQLGVGASDLDTLLLLAEAGPQAAGRIAEALAITTGAVTGLVDRLERQGWVERTRHDADRRQVLVELAAAKKSVIAALRASREQALAAATVDDDDDAIATAARVVDAAAERLVVAASELAASGAEPDAPDAGDRSPIGAIEDATLRFASGVARLELRGARIRDLYRAEFHGRRPVVSVERGGVLAIQYKGLSWWRSRDVAATLTLTSAVSWAIEIGRGASHLTADLRELHVRSIDITGGASECDVRLPRPRGAATVRIKGGASHVVLRRPRGVAVQAIVRGGANSLELDDQSIGAFGSTARLATPGADQAADRWTIELTGGASHLAISEE
jgi:DNA-binding MarR family transcriptional regulator